MNPFGKKVLKVFLVVVNGLVLFTAIKTALEYLFKLRIYGRK